MVAFLGEGSIASFTLGLGFRLVQQNGDNPGRKGSLAFKSRDVGNDRKPGLLSDVFGRCAVLHDGLCQTDKGSMVTLHEETERLGVSAAKLLEKQTVRVNAQAEADCGDEECEAHIYSDHCALPERCGVTKRR